MQANGLGICFKVTLILNNAERMHDKYTALGKRQSVNVSPQEAHTASKTFIVYLERKRYSLLEFRGLGMRNVLRFEYTVSTCQLLTQFQLVKWNVKQGPEGILTAADLCMMQAALKRWHRQCPKKQAGGDDGLFFSSSLIPPLHSLTVLPSSRPNQLSEGECRGTALCHTH